MLQSEPMSPEHGIDRKENQDSSGEREFVFWKYLHLINMQEAERLGIPEGPVFVSPHIKGEIKCRCGVDYSPIIYHKGLIKAQHYHEPEDGGIYHYATRKEHFEHFISSPMYNPTWIAILGPVSFSMNPLKQKLLGGSGIFSHISSETVNVLQFRAFFKNQEIKEGFLVTNDRGKSLFPSSTKDHPFITELGFRIIEDGSVQFFRDSSLAPRSF